MEQRPARHEADDALHLASEHLRLELLGERGGGGDVLLAKLVRRHDEHLPPARRRRGARVHVARRGVATVGAHVGQLGRALPEVRCAVARAAAAFDDSASSATTSEDDDGVAQ